MAQSRRQGPWAGSRAAALLLCMPVLMPGRQADAGILKVKSLPKSSTMGFCLDNTTSGPEKP